MIHKAMPSAGSKGAAIGHSGVVTVLAQTAMPLDQIQFQLPEQEPAGRMPALPEDQFELAEEGSISAPWIEPESQAPVFFDLDDDVETVAPLDEGSHRETQPAYAELLDAPTDQSPWHTAAELADGNAETPVDQIHDEFEVSNNGDRFEVHNELVLDSAAGETAGLPGTDGEASVDPWDDPLPAWDYSRNEWPVLLGPDQQGSETKHRAIFGALALVVIGALIYFLIFRPGSPQQNATAATNSSAQESSDGNELHATAAEPAAVEEPHASAAEPAAGEAQNDGAPSAPQASKTEQPAADTAATSNESNNTNGRFSLQAAAFPTEEGANQFAEKLKRAGVPSYIIAADIARRGRWFRVRVGRFNSAADAGRFASEAQMRAGAVGLSLQLMPCQYEQP